MSTRIAALAGFAASALYVLVASAQTLAPVAGCGPEAATDPKPQEHKPARCAPNAPAPKPLAAKTTLKLASLPTVENFAPIALGIAKGEFAKENLEIEVVNIPVSDALTLLANEKLDIIYSGPTAGFYNAINQGFKLAWVGGNWSPPADGKSGLWALKGTTVAGLKGKTIGTVVGPDSATMYPTSVVLKTAGLTPADVTLQRFDFASMPIGLKNGGMAAGWILDPQWTQFVNDPDFVFLGGQTLGEPIGGTMFGPGLLEKNRAAGTAFMRAFTRIVNTYFDGDYKKNDAFMQELSAALKIPVDSLKRVPAMIWDWEIRGGTTDRVQQTFVQTKALQYPAPLPEAKVVDRGFYQEAVGRKF